MFSLKRYKNNLCVGHLNLSIVFLNLSLSNSFEFGYFCRFHLNLQILVVFIYILFVIFFQRQFYNFICMYILKVILGIIVGEEIVF